MCLYFSGGLSTRANVKIQLTDVNDNLPIFYPREYNVSLAEGGSPGAVLSVAASDRDSGNFGRLTYRITSGNSDGLFRLDPNSGELSLTRPVGGQRRTYRLTIVAVDGGGLSSRSHAEVYVSVEDPRSPPPQFIRTRYSMAVREDVQSNTLVGTVKATQSGKDIIINLSIIRK